MSEHRREKIQELIMHTASNFVASESNKNSLITVTNVLLNDDFSEAKILVTVYPDDKVKAAIDFLKRSRSEFKRYFKEKTRLNQIPLFDFDLDFGEKSRQRIDEISNNL